jgi:RNA polymerase sigma-70 factor (ECF subfamily)
LTVVSRRIVVRELLSRKMPASLGDGAMHLADANGHSEQRIIDREEIARLLEELPPGDAEIVRLYHLEGKSYREISQATGVPENTIGPLLSRARMKMRQAGADPAVI